MDVNTVCLSQCNADGCYKKQQKGKAFCKEHEKEIDEGKTVIGFYGKKITKRKVK